MLCAHKFGLTHGVGVGHDLMHQAVTPGHHVAGGSGALKNDDVFDRLTAAHRQAFIHNRLERQLFAPAQLVVGRDHSDCTGVLDALLQAFGRKAAKHDRMRGANAGAGLHGHHAFDRHGHVDDNAVAFFDAHGLERAGKLADLGVQLLVSHVRDGAVVALKNDGVFVLGRCAQVTVQTVVRCV